MKLVRCKKDDLIFCAQMKEDGRLYPITGDVYSSFQTGEKSFSLLDVVLLAPTVPTKIVAVGKNYVDHIKELGGAEPDHITLFLKPETSILDPMGTILCPAISERVDFEGELAFVIKKKAFHIKKEDSAQYILGYTCLNDVTARDIQTYDQQWTRAKGFDTFCPVGPVITDEINPDEVEIRTLLNGEIKQSSNTKHMKWKCPEILEFVTECMTLHPGDIVTTGTPSGIGKMTSGDTVIVEIEGIGQLINCVKDSKGE